MAKDTEALLSDAVQLLKEQRERESPSWNAGMPQTTTAAVQWWRDRADNLIDGWEQGRKVSE